MIFCGVSQIYKSTKKPLEHNHAMLKAEIDLLKQRVKS